MFFVFIFVTFLWAVFFGISIDVNITNVPLNDTFHRCAFSGCLQYSFSLRCHNPRKSPDMDVNTVGRYLTNESSHTFKTANVSPTKFGYNFSQI